MRTFICVAAMLLWVGATATAAESQTDSKRTYRGWPTEFDGPYPKGMPPGDGWKVLSGDQWLASSDCIGSFESPECVLDTIMACEAWSKRLDTTIYREGDQEMYWFWHPVCGKLKSNTTDPSDRMFIRYTIGLPPSGYERQILYYRSTQFVFERDDDHGTKNLKEGWRCHFDGHRDWCVGDVVVPFVQIYCRAFGKDNGPSPWKRDIPIYSDTPRVDDCYFKGIERAVIVRKNTDDHGWSIIGYYDAAERANAESGWPYLEKILQGMR